MYDIILFYGIGRNKWLRVLWHKLRRRFRKKSTKLNGRPKKKTFTKVVNFLRARRQNPAKTKENCADLADNVADLADKVADLVDNVKFPNS